MTGRRGRFICAGVQFHDGSELTAEAVRFSFERLLTMGQSPFGHF